MCQLRACAARPLELEIFRCSFAAGVSMRAGAYTLNGASRLGPFAAQHGLPRRRGKLSEGTVTLMLKAPSGQQDSGAVWQPSSLNCS